MFVFRGIKWFPWELNSPVEPGLEHGRMPRWIFPCMTAFLSAMTSASNESKLSLLCLIHTCACDVWFLFVLTFAYFTVITTEMSLCLLSVFEIVGWLKIELLGSNKGMTFCLSSYPTPPSSLRPCLQHAPWQCESMWGGIWETKGQPHDVSHTDSDRQEQALVCVQRSHHYWVPGQRSWLVNTSCICLWTHKFCPGCQLVVI